MKPQEPIPHNYRMETLNKIFAISSLVLVALTLVMIWYDYTYVRGWKKFQSGFLNLQKTRLQNDLRAEQQQESQGQMAALVLRMKAGEAEIARNRESYRRAQRSLDDWEGKHYAADQDYRFAKAKLDAMRYDAETSLVQKRDDAGDLQQAFLKQRNHLDRLKLELEEVTRSRDAAKAEVDRWLKKITDVEDESKKLTASRDLLTKQLAAVNENEPAFVLLNRIPLIDFVSPTLKVDQVVLKDMFVDVNFMRVPRVDRCMTCHRAIDRSGFESQKEAARLQAELQQKLDTFRIDPDKVADTKARIEQLKRIQSEKAIPNPYRTHPQLDAFVGSASPHPLLEFGCTVCHHGQDRATDFARAGHTPDTGKRMEKWERKYGWEHQDFLETPMKSRQYYEAACLKCHSDQITVSKGESITRSTQMVELYGCYACHKINSWRFTNLRKPGPDLNGIAEKTNPEWALRWISEPHDFRSTTRMPSFFYQRNMIGPAVNDVEREDNKKKQNAEIHAIVAYLFANSSHRAWQGGGAGDPGRGKTLVESVGCLGCHIAQDTFTDKEGKTRPARRTDFPLERNYGFNLVGTGTKVNPNWLFNWVKNPKRYYVTAPMPDLRLSDQEASDVVAYLMSMQKPGFMQKQIPPVDRKALAELTRSYLINTLSERDADARIQRMPLNEQLVYLGQRTIEKYGCYSCHNIKGFEKAKPIGTELTIEGSKALHLFDFGFVHEYAAHDGDSEEHKSPKEEIIHTVPSWVYNKLRSPRVYDDQRAKVYQEKLKMPNFYFTPEEAQTVAQVVLGMTKDMVAANKLAGQDPLVRVAEEGRKLVSQHNCRACHVVDGYGRQIAPLISDAAYLPPDLTPEGGRAQSPWLFNFLKDPTVMKIRPWLNVRMPTFHFEDAEANTLVQFFAAEGKIPTFDTTRQMTPDPASVAIGHTMFDMMRCAQCHPTGAVVGTPVAGDTTSLAPTLQYARVRLRYDWIPDWIRRPNEMIPGTRMPTNFPRDAETGNFVSPLANVINAPQFAQYKVALVQRLGSEEEVNKLLKDVPRITGYMRDYIWSIGITEMKAPQSGVESPPTNAAPPPAVPASRELKSSRASSPPTGVNHAR